jgi:Putative Actinobacterial Holin-X, holin superfamily III
MQSTIKHLEAIVTKAGEVAETKVELWKMKATGKISEMVSSIISKFAIVLLALVALTILSFGLAYWIGAQLGNVYYGFFIMGGFYVLAGLFVFIFRKSWIQEPISDLIIHKIIKE